MSPASSDAAEHVVIDASALVDLLGNLGAAPASPSCGATESEPAGNPGKTSRAGVGYRHGKTAPSGAAKAA